jgi:6-phosphogluconolactonase
MKKWPISYDERREIAIPGKYDTSVQFAVDHFLSTAFHSVEKEGYFAVALAGGSTPKAIYKGILDSQKKDKIDWKRVLLFWSDERCVPKEHPDSNYRMAMETAFAHLPIPSDNIFPLNGVGDLEKNASDYENLIRNIIPEQRFDLVLLGMGDDGHVASLFPKTHGLHVEHRLVIANFVPSKDVWRMTLTFNCINSAQHIALSVFGAGKAKTVKEIFSLKYDSDELPAQKVGTAEHKALWIMDEAASFELTSANNI